MRKLLMLILCVPIFGHAQFNDLIKKAKEKLPTSVNTNSIDIASGLKEALNKGIEKQVAKLTSVDGFYKNEMVKILLPDELRKVDAALRKIGMSKLADDGIRSLNRAAEDAVKEATPVFVAAVKDMTVTDAKGILMGKSDAATNYLEKSTSSPLYAKFQPVVANSIGKVGADKVWAAIISKYNTLPFVTKVNPDINDHVTKKALEGVYKMIAVEELAIRTNLGARTSPLLKKVFAMQDKK